MKELENLAELVKAQLDLAYDEPSVKFIEGFIERQKVRLEGNNREGMINSVGAFLGQCIIQNFGGVWKHDTDTGSICVAFDDKNKAFPFSKVRKQFDNGLEDSVFPFYTSIPLLFKSKLEEKKKPWWRF